MSAMRHVALQEVAQIEREILEASAIEDGTLYVGLENIESGGRFVGVRPVAAGELLSSKFSFTPRHLLYGKLRPYLAKIARPDFVGICSTDILPILPGPDLDRGYLAWLLLSPQMVAQASSRATGANLPRLSPNALAELKIPLPPLPEQRRIAEILDKADALRAKRRAAHAQLDTLIQSIFLDMFGDPATNPKGWVRKCAGRLGTVTTGNTPARDDPRNYGDAIEWIKSDNLNTSDYYATRASEGLSEAGMACARIVPAGAILVTCIAGSPSSIGNAAMVNRPVAFNQQINAFVPEGGNPHFFFAQLTVGKRLVQQASTGGMKGLVSKGRFEKILLMEPPPDLQDRFSELASRIEGIKSGLDAALAQMEALFASLQHRAFRGEL
jgi:type I restriction enzyme S subunit